MDAKEERRGQIRIEARWPVTIYVDSEAMEGESRNISPDGIFICCDKPLPLNEVVRVSIKPPDYQAIGVAGRVIWSDLYGIDENKSVHCVGICMVEISQNDRTVLSELMENYI